MPRGAWTAIQTVPASWPSRSGLVAFVRLGTSDSGDLRPHVSAQQGGCSDRYFTGSPLRDQRTVGDLKQFLLDGALVGHHPAFEPASCIDAAGDRGTELAPGQRLGHGELPPA